MSEHEWVPVNPADLKPGDEFKRVVGSQMLGGVARSVVGRSVVAAYTTNSVAQVSMNGDWFVRRPVDLTPEQAATEYKVPPDSSVHSKTDLHTELSPEPTEVGTVIEGPGDSRLARGDDKRRTGDLLPWVAISGPYAGFRYHWDDIEDDLPRPVSVVSSPSMVAELRAEIADLREEIKGWHQAAKQLNDRNKKAQAALAGDR